MYINIRNCSRYAVYRGHLYITDILTGPLDGRFNRFHFSDDGG